MSNLPVKSTSRGVQRRHVRRLQTRSGVKDVLVNPKVNKNVVQRPVEGSRVVRPVVESKSVGVRGPAESLGLKLRWQDVLKVDDGSARPISVPKRYSFEELKERVWNSMEFFPDRNEADFVEEYVDDPVKELLDKINDSNVSGMIMSEEEVDAAITEIVKEANAILEDDLSDPGVTLQYDDDERGYIGSYTSYEADDFEAVWVRSGGYSGYYDVKADPKKWTLLHDDNILAYSSDEKNLYTFHELLTKTLKDNGINFVGVFGRTSNVFSTTYNLFIEKGKYGVAKKFSDKLAKIYRREEDYLAEVNPLYQGVKAAKSKGMDRSDILKLTAQQTKDPAVKKLLLDAMRLNELGPEDDS